MGKKETRKELKKNNRTSDQPTQSQDLDIIIKKVEKNIQNFTYDKGLKEGVKRYNDLKRDINDANQKLDILAKMIVDAQNIEIDTNQMTDLEFKECYDEIQTLIKDFDNKKNLENKIALYEKIANRIKRCREYINSIGDIEVVQI